MSTLRTILLQLLILCLTGSSFAQAPDWIWARSSGAVSNDYSNAVCTDADGNVYIAGTFQGATISFGNYVLQNTAEGFLDYFVVKYDPQGNVLWAISNGGSKDDYAYGICVDPTGNVLVTGYFNSPSLAIGPSTLLNISTAVNAPDVFTAKYAMNGDAVWGRSGDAGPGQDYARAYGIGADSLGNVYITGHFGFGTVSFDGNTLQTNGELDMFLVKYDTDGNVQWVRRMGGNQTDGAQAIHVDPSGNSYITGWFVNDADFDGITLVSTNPAAYMEVFVAKYGSTGDCVWANYALVPYAGNYASANGITTDQQGSVYITGYYQISISFGPDSLGNQGNRGIFLAKYDSTGTPLWGRSPGGTGNDYGTSVSVEPDGNVLCSGYFTSAFLNFGQFPVINDNVASYDGFVARYDPNGNALGAVGISGAGDEYAMGVASSPAGDLYSAGYFGSYSLDFSGVVLTNAGSYDTYLAKLDRNGFVGVTSIEGPGDVSVYPNPAKDQIHVLSEGRTEIRVYDVASRLILDRQFMNSTTIDVSDLPSGMYVYHLMRDGTVVNGKFVLE